MAATGAFWAFSLRLYAEAEVAAHCLDLQDRFNVDVNILLYLLFRATAAVTLDAPAIAALDAGVRDWRRTVVQPLRGVRRALKAHDAESPAHAALRGQLKAAELEAERLEQLQLEAAAPRGSPAVDSTAAARLSVTTYLASCGATENDATAILAAFASTS